MAAAFTVQNDDGDEADANAYITVEFFQQYHEDRGRDVSAITDDDIKIGIVRATDYVDNRFADRFAGQPLGVWPTEQTTQFPREYAYYNSGTEIEGIPIVLQKAIAEYALRASGAELLQDPPEPIDSDGNYTNGRLTSLDQTVGPVSEKKVFQEYYTSPGSGVGLVSGDLLPVIPAADILINQLLTGGGHRTAIRA